MHIYIVMDQNGELIFGVVELGEFLEKLSQKWCANFDENANCNFWPFSLLRTKNHLYIYGDIFLLIRNHNNDLHFLAK